MHIHLAGRLVNSALFEGILQWWSMRKYILKHTQMTKTFDIKIILLYYFRLGTAELHWNVFSTLKDGFDILKFFNRKWVLNMCTVGNL